MRGAKIGRWSGALLILGGGLWLGAVATGPLPPLGAFLDPVHGVWATVRPAELPALAEEVIAGLQAPVDVAYDQRGVPHIFAQNIPDVIRAMGYVVARDRLFQMEGQVRASAGRLTELIGKKGLASDKFMRRIGLRASAEKHFAQLAPDSEPRQLFDAYTQGVNAWIDGLTPAEVPLEYHLLGAQPARWQPVNTLYISKQMGYTLTFRATERMKRYAAQRVGRKAADAIFSVDCPIQEPLQPNGQTEPRFDCPPLPPPAKPAPTDKNPVTQYLLPHDQIDRSVVGSNNWAVAPAKTASGHALLAGDPHLRLSLPAIWYEVHLVVPGELDVYGVTIPGVPAVVIGFNRHLAWTFTNGGIDVLDFYKERLDDEKKPTRYFMDGAWHSLGQRVEHFYDQQGELLESETVYLTHRGPVLFEKEGTVSLRWVVLEQERSEVTFKLGQARSVAEWLKVWGTFLAPAQNGVVADTQGHIGFRTSGKFPIRPAHSPGDWLQDGSTSKNDWLGYHPAAEQPMALDPAQGYLASSNQQIVDPQQDKKYLGADWPPPWRAMRINQLLRSGQGLQAADMQRFQTDSQSARPDVFVPAFLAAARAGAANDELLQTAGRLLGQWDRRYTRDSNRAALFVFAMQKLSERAWDEFDDPEKEETPYWYRPDATHLACLLQIPDSPWWDIRATTDQREDRDTVLAASLKAALLALRQEHGPEDGGAWRWDKIRQMNIYHLLKLAGLSVLGVPNRGGPTSLNPMTRSGTHGASFRLVVDLAPELRAWTTYPGGQSGNPASSRYDDRIAQWSAGELTEVLFPKKPEELAGEQITSRLTLQPRK